jgi:hypothetical protein
MLATDVRLEVMVFAVALVASNAGCSDVPQDHVESTKPRTAPPAGYELEREIAEGRRATPERVAFHIENLSRGVSHHCTTWARDPGCREITCPLTACRYLNEVATTNPALLVPYLRDQREGVRNWGRSALLLEYGDDALPDWEVEDSGSHNDDDHVAANLRRDTFIEKWERFSRGLSVLPRRSPATPVAQGTIPRCWPSCCPPAWWPEDGADWPRVHPEPTCCEGGSVVPDGSHH